VNESSTHPHRSVKEADPHESLSPEMIRAQLERIVASALFVRKKQLCHFLTYVVEKTLSGEPDRLKGYTIAVEAFGRNPDFNPQLDPVVRVRATQLRNVLQRYYQSEGSHDIVRIDVPKGGYVPTFQEHQWPRTDTDTAAGEASQDILLLEEVNANHPTIAVLQLENLNANPKQAYFAIGLTQEFVTALMRFADFIVVGPLLRDRLRADGFSARDIYRAYGARFLLDGSVHWHNGSLRVKAKLIETRRGVNLWSETYQHKIEADNWFEIEDDVAGRVVATIADTFGVIHQTLWNEGSSQPPACGGVYDAMLRFQHAMYFPTPEATTEALQALERAHQEVPHHVTITAMLADLYGQQFFLGMRDESVLERIEPLVRQAISLDPNHQHARWVAGWLHFFRLETEPCARELNIVMSLNPNHANLVGATAYLLAMLGQWNQAIPLARKALRLNPHHPGWYHFVFYLGHYRHGEYAAALNDALKINSPDFFIDALCRAAVLGQLGHISKANAAFQELLSLMPDFMQSGRKQLRIVVFSEAHVEMLWDGLIKAGLDTIGY